MDWVAAFAQQQRFETARWPRHAHGRVCCRITEPLGAKLPSPLLARRSDHELQAVMAFTSRVAFRCALLPLT
jgi:hypothetical protein